MASKFGGVQPPQCLRAFIMAWIGGAMAPRYLTGWLSSPDTIRTHCGHYAPGAARRGPCWRVPWRRERGRTAGGGQEVSGLPPTVLASSYRQTRGQPPDQTPDGKG